MQEAFFSFELPTRILFGVGALGNLRLECDTHGWKSALIVTDSGVRQAGLLERLTAQLEGLDYAVYDGILPNPTVQCIEGAVALAQGRDVLIALGGGSVLDSAKALNAVKTHGGSVLHYEGNDAVPGPCGPLVAIPTTAGTGSEVTFIAMVTVPERQQKLPLVSRYLAPTLAIVDPELTRTLPPSVTAHTGLDALTHAVETLVSVSAQPIADLLALQAIKLITQYLPMAVKEGENMEARANLSYAALTAGIAFSNGWTGMAHALAHALGGLYDLPHGLCCALALPATMEFNLETQRAKYEQIAQALGAASAQEGIARVRELMREVGVPMRLRDVGVPESDLDKITELALADGTILFNPRQPSAEELRALVQKVF
ncbi:MAG: iron-containing alcohol dehydrogenase [Candidatus Bipolaricaulota bacterium]|nr:iron-containing alcohol dehydrogenase [Candidatus Bipolaricaulota bacterium]